MKTRRSTQDEPERHPRLTPLAAVVTAALALVAFTVTRITDEALDNCDALLARHAWQEAQRHHQQEQEQQQADAHTEADTA